MDVESLSRSARNVAYRACSVSVCFDRFSRFCSGSDDAVFDSAVLAIDLGSGDAERDGGFGAAKAVALPATIVVWDGFERG